MKKAPGKSHRKGLALLDIANMFCNEQAAREWIAKQRWPMGVSCPHCGSHNVQCWIKHPSQTHRCRDCPGRSMFSVKTRTVMEGSNLSCTIWAIGIYLFTTNIKGISSMRIHRELGIGQKAAWFVLHRLRKAYEAQIGIFNGPVEVDETYMGGREGNKHASKKLNVRGGSVGKTAVIGVKDRDTNAVQARVVQRTDRVTLHGFVEECTVLDAQVYTDNAVAYRGMDRTHATVNHSVGEYVRGVIHTNGVEAFWAIFKRAHKGTYHKMSDKHLQRYVDEFVGRHNQREYDTIEQMAEVVVRMSGRRLRYHELIADNGWDSGAR